MEEVDDATDAGVKSTEIAEIYSAGRKVMACSGWEKEKVDLPRH